MSERRTSAINLRMSPEVKALLRLASEKEHRTLSNMLEYLVLQYCEVKGLRLSGENAVVKKKTKPERGAT